MRSSLVILLVAVSCVASADDLAPTVQPDPACEKLASGEWWKRKTNRITPLDVPRDQVIAFALYTHHNGTLKITAQLYPLYLDEALDVTLQFKRDGQWTTQSVQPIHRTGWNTTFRIDDWDNTKKVAYRLRHGEKATYEGLIRRDPIDKDVITLAAFSCDSPKMKVSREE